jgi:hypothetical protein
MNEELSNPADGTKVGGDADANPGAPVKSDADVAFELEPAPEVVHSPPPKSEAVKRAIELEREQMTRKSSLHDDDDDEEDVQSLTGPLLRANLQNSNFYFGLAGVLLVAAAYFGAANTKPNQEALPIVISTVYNAALHSGTGLVAAWCWSKIEARPLGSWRDVLARMSVGVCAAWFFFNMQLGLELKLEEPLLGLAAYLCVLIVLMRWTPKRAFRVACVHFALILVFFLAMVLHVWASTGN